MTPDDFVFDDTSFQPPRPPEGAVHTHAELIRAAQNIGQRLEEQQEDLEDDAAALRWRRALLRLSETFLDAAQERRDLSPILLSALQNALEQLLVHGDEADLMALEEWLGHEAAAPSRTVSTESDGSERRTQSDRRQGERRSYTERRQATQL